MTPIYLRNLPPPDETFDHIFFLSWLAKWIKPTHYLELGVRDGASFLAIAPHCQKATGIDIFRYPFDLPPNAEFFLGTTDDFFKDPLNETFDMVFIDADHSHEQSLKDFLNVFPYVIEDGFIFFHDSYPCAQYLFDITKSFTCYKTPLYIKQMMIDQCEILTLPFNPGVTIVKKISRNKQLIYDIKQ